MGVRSKQWAEHCFTWWCLPCHNRKLSDTIWQCNSFRVWWTL